MITPESLGGDEEVARRVLVLARSVAPGVDVLDPLSEQGKDAIAVLRGVIAELPAAGMGRIASQSRNGTSVSVRAVDSAFSSDARLMLRQIMGTKLAGLPVGEFPAAQVWPGGS